MINQRPKVKINSASRLDIEAMDKIGSRLADRILDYRERIGYFQGPHDLAKVKGISIKLANTLADQIDWELPKKTEQETQRDKSGKNVDEFRKRNRFLKILYYFLVLISIALGLLIISAFYFVINDRSIVSVSTKRKDSVPPYSLKIQISMVPSQDGFHENMEFDISFDENINVLTDELGVTCLKKLYVQFIFTDQGKATRDQKVSYPLSSACTVNENNSSPKSGESARTASFQFIDDEGYWYGKYPFDSHFVTANFWIEGSLPNNEPMYISSGDIDVDINIPNWSVKTEIHNINVALENGDEKATQLTINLHRSLGIRILTVVLILGLFFFILLLAFIPDMSSALEVSVGILLGLFGIQSILIPPSIKNQTPIHEAIIFLYLLFGLIAFIRFLVIPVKKKIHVEN